MQGVGQRRVARIVWLAGALLLLLLGCAVSKQDFRRNFVYEPVRAAGTIEESVQIEASHAISPGVVEVWKRWGNPQENIDNWREVVAEVIRDDMLRSGLLKTPQSGAAPDLIFRLEGLESEQPESHIRIVLTVLDPRSRSVVSRYERQASLGTSALQYGERMKAGISSILGGFRQELLADYQGGKLRQAMAALRATRAARAHLDQAAAAQAQGDLAAAVAALRLARQADPAGPAPAAAAVALLHRLCDPEAARRLGEEARKQHPADAGLQAAVAGTGLTPDPKACEAQALNRAAVASAREGRRPEALAKLTEARRLAPGLVPKASYNAALLLEQRGQPAEAATAYLEARRGFLEAAEAQEALTRLTALAQRAKLPVPEPADRRYRLGVVRAQQKRYPEAAAEFEAALAEAPWLVDAYYNLGLVYDFTGRAAEALEALRAYLALAPQSPHAGAVKTKVVELEDRLGVGPLPMK